MNRTLTLIAMLCFVLSSWGQKSIYVPTGWTEQSAGVYYEQSSGKTWKKSNSKESTNFIVYWDDDYKQAPNQLSSSNAYYVDIDDLLAKAETFYNLECETLGFVDPTTSNVGKYKIIICLNYTTEWICTGAGYDYQVPALWLSPSTCKPVGSAVAHEVGHSFHYMCYSEASKQGTLSGVETGFHSAIGNGSTVWETTANWQALQSYPNEFFTESGMSDVFAMSHNYAFSHEWHRYQAYPFFYYLCKRYDDIKTIANVWNYSETTKKEFNQVLMDYKGLNASDFFELYYDFAAKCVTWDFSPITVPSSQIGNFKYNCIQTADDTYQVAYSSCPQPTGFNVIPLTGFKAGVEFSIDFTSLADGAPLATNDPQQYMNDETRYVSTDATKYNNFAGATARGFRVGFVARLSDGTCQYFGGDARICTGSGEATQTLTCTPPANVRNMWMVVVPAPSRYVQHKWDENISNDDQLPYKFKINSGVSLNTSKATVTQGYEQPNANEKTFSFELERNINRGYDGDNIDITTDLANALEFLGASSLSDCKTYWVNPDGTMIENPMPTYDGWSTAEGTASTWGNNTAVCVKFQPVSNLIWVCTFPGTDSTDGTAYTCTNALTYGDKTAYFTLTTTLVKPAAIPLTDYEIVGTYDYTAEAYPDNTYAATTVSLSTDATTIASLLGLADLSACTYFATAADGGLTKTFTAGPGYWFGPDGIPTNYGNNSPFYVETDFATELRFGQFPEACQGGETFTATVYFGNETAKKLVKMNLTYKINEMPLESLTVASKEFTYTVDAKPNNTFATTPVDITQDASEMASLIGVSNLGATLFYTVDQEGKLTSSYSANTGYFFNAEGAKENYGENARFYIQTDKATFLEFGQMPGTNKGGETYTATLYFGSKQTAKAVKINVTYNILPLKLSDVNIVKTYDIEVSDNYKTRFGTPKSEDIDKAEILSLLQLSSLSLENLYGKTLDETGFTKTKTANLGFFFNANGAVQNYGEGCKFFAELITDDAGATLSIDQFPGGMKPEETLTTALYLINPETQTGVQINLTYKVNKLSIGYVTEKIDAMLNGDANVGKFDIETLINAILSK